MKWLICLCALFVVGGIAFAADSNMPAKEPNQAAIVGHESQQAAQRGTAEGQKEQAWGTTSSAGGMYGAKDANSMESYEKKMRERHQERIAELKRIRSIAQGENATKTVAALDDLIARENQLYKERMTSTKHMGHNMKDANSK